jgi:hypothetical protein
MRSALGKILCGLIFAGLVAASAAGGAQSSSTPFIQGRLGFEMGTGPVLQTQSKSVTLSARNAYLFHTLGDPRLRNKEVRLEGTKLPDGSFQVERILTLHDGKLYRVRYYCETCNIVALEPGRCVCCQQPVELQEIPLDKNDKHIIVTK